MTASNLNKQESTDTQGFQLNLVLDSMFYYCSLMQNSEIIHMMAVFEIFIMSLFLCTTLCSRGSLNHQIKFKKKSYA